MHPIDNKENSDLQILQEQLETQYGPAIAQDIIDRMRREKPAAKAPDYMDVKAMSELAERFRGQAMIDIWTLKEWRRAQEAMGAEQNLIQLEGVMLERQCQNAIRLYRQTHKNYFSMYREAMAAFTGQTHPTFAQYGALRTAC